MKIWEKIIEARISDKVKISEQQYGFMPGNGNYRYHVCFKNVDKKVQGR